MPPVFKYQYHVCNVSMSIHNNGVPAAGFPGHLASFFQFKEVKMDCDREGCIFIKIVMISFKYQYHNVSMSIHNNGVPAAGFPGHLASFFQFKEVKMDCDQEGCIFIKIMSGMLHNDMLKEKTSYRDESSVEGSTEKRHDNLGTDELFYTTKIFLFLQDCQDRTLGLSPADCVYGRVKRYDGRWNGNIANKELSKIPKFALYQYNKSCGHKIDLFHVIAEKWSQGNIYEYYYKHTGLHLQKHCHGLIIGMICMKCFFFFSWDIRQELKPVIAILFLYRRTSSFNLRGQTCTKDRQTKIGSMVSEVINNIIHLLAKLHRKKRWLSHVGPQSNKNSFEVPFLGNLQAEIGGLGTLIWTLTIQRIVKDPWHKHNFSN
ncbi:hypothetical protein ACJX0J_011192 [Zea mays]